MVEPVYEEIGRAVRRHRDSAGLTQTALADRVGLSRASIANVEAGRQAVAVHHLYRIAEAIGVEVTDLLRDLAPNAGAQPRPRGT